MAESLEPAGAEAEAGPSDDSALEIASTTNLSVLTLLRLREQLKQQLMECLVAARANQESYPDQDIEEMFIVRDMENLERELEELKISFKNKSLFMQRIQLVDALRNKMTENDDETRLIVETMKHTVMLNHAIIASQQQTREIEEKLNDIKKKRFKENEQPNTFLQERNAVSGAAAFFPFLKQAEEEKLLQIHVVMKKRKKQNSVEMGQRLECIHKNLQIERAMTTLIQNIFQNIIIGSGVNWAEDPSLKAIVLKLEKKL